MNLLRAAALSLSLVLLASCGGDGGSGSDAGTAPNTESGETDGELVANGSEVETVDTTEVPDAELVPVSGCLVTASQVDLTPIWKGQAVGLAVILSRDDEVIYTTEPAAADSSGNEAFSDVDVELGAVYRYSVETVDRNGNKSDAVPCGSGQLLAQSSDVACGVRVSDAGLPEVTWDGVLLVQDVAVLRDGAEIDTDVTSPFVDTKARTGAVSRYSIVVTDLTNQGRDEQTIECGEAAPYVAESGGTFDLAGAIEASQSFLSPFQYVRLEPICPGCPTSAELYLVPLSEGPVSHIIDQVWIAGKASPERDALWMIDPLAVAAALDAAQRAGGEVTYDIDIDTGLIRAWTIDGVGARYACVEIDTAPIEARSRQCTAGIFND